VPLSVARQAHTEGGDTATTRTRTAGGRGETTTSFSPGVPQKVFQRFRERVDGALLRRSVGPAGGGQDRVGWRLRQTEERGGSVMKESIARWAVLALVALGVGSPGPTSTNTATAGSSPSAVTSGSVGNRGIGTRSPRGPKAWATGPNVDYLRVRERLWMGMELPADTKLYLRLGNRWHYYTSRWGENNQEGGAPMGVAVPGRSLHRQPVPGLRQDRRFGLVGADRPPGPHGRPEADARQRHDHAGRHAL